MRSSVRTQVVESMAAYATDPRPKWVREWPAMVVLAVSAIYWSNECQDAISGECPHSDPMAQQFACCMRHPLAVACEWAVLAEYEIMCFYATISHSALPTSHKNCE